MHGSDRVAAAHWPWLTLAGVGLAGLTYMTLPRKILGRNACIEHTPKILPISASASETEIRSDGLLLNSLVDRSLRDLRLSKTNIGAQEFFAAGVPWYVMLL
jgi:hypothetical protein